MRLRSAVLASTLSLGAGCASDEAARRDEARAARQQAWEARHSQIKEASDEEDQSSPEMVVKGEEGSLNAADVESAITKYLPEFLDCYRLGRGTQRVGARVLMRFFVDGKGEVEDVAILESNLGKGGVVERCLADIAVGVVFVPPSGRKPTTFEYPFEFRPARQVTAARQRRR